MELLSSNSGSQVTMVRGAWNTPSFGARLHPAASNAVNIQTTFLIQA